MPQYTFAKNLKKLRIERRISQEELARKTHMTQENISMYENALRYPPLDKVYDIASVLGVDVADLLRDI